MTDRQWITRFSAALGVEPPADDEFESLLELAGVAAHASARTAAPVACWVAAGAGVSPAEALSVARGIG